MRNVFGLAVLAACLGAPAQAQQLDKFTFALNWFPVGDHAAYWVALEKGYFKERGLDVTLENSKGSGDSIAKVDTGGAEGRARRFRRGDGLPGARRAHQGRRHDLRQDAPQRLQPQGRPDR